MPEIETTGLLTFSHGSQLSTFYIRNAAFVLNVTCSVITILLKICFVFFNLVTFSLMKVTS